MSDIVENKAGAATPARDLEDYILNPNVAKGEAEWWASREIKRLRAENERLRVVLREASDDIEAAYREGANDGADVEAGECAYPAFNDTRAFRAISVISKALQETDSGT